MDLSQRRSTRVLAVSAAVAALGAGILVQGVGARSNVGAPVRQSGSANHTLNVNGHGEVLVTPDMATISVGVQSRGQDARDAMSRNSNSLNAVVAAIKAQGISSSRIQTTDLSLWFDSEHNAYVASHNLSVRLDDVNKVGAVLDTAIAAGATNSWGVSFDLKEPAAARSQALQAAVADSRKRADSMASALGVTVSGVGSASESSYNMTPPRYVAAASQAPAPAATQVQPGQLTISADVTVTYTFG